MFAGAAEAPAQHIWKLYSKDVKGNGWAETVAEDHSDLHSGENHIRAVVHNELRPVGERMAALETQMGAVIELLNKLAEK